MIMQQAVQVGGTRARRSAPSSPNFPCAKRLPEAGTYIETRLDRGGQRQTDSPGAEWTKPNLVAHERHSLANSAPLYPLHTPDTHNSVRTSLTLAVPVVLLHVSKGGC